MAVEFSCCETGFLINIVIVVLLVAFAGLMSGLSIGLISMSLVDLEVLAKSGTPTARKHAGWVSSVSNGNEISVLYKESTANGYAKWVGRLNDSSRVREEWQQMGEAQNGWAAIMYKRTKLQQRRRHLVEKGDHVGTWTLSIVLLLLIGLMILTAAILEFRLMKILPVVKNQHLLLCTLLIYNGFAMEALPIFLDNVMAAWVAIVMSVTLILLFAEIIPHSVCARHGLPIGAKVALFVQVLMWICLPVAYPITKLLDFLLGKEHVALFRRAELKTFVYFHGNRAGKGGELTHNETTIIAGALELTEKKVGDTMTSILETFSIDISAKIDRDLMKLISLKGHSRVPVYYQKPTNIIGLILAKNLLAVRPEDEAPVKSVTIRKIPRVSETMPLYDILNEFEKGHSHMAVVVRESKNAPAVPENTQDNNNPVREIKVDIDGEAPPQDKNPRVKRSLWRKRFHSGGSGSYRRQRSKKWRNYMSADVLQMDGNPFSIVPEEEEAIGIITMEDVIEELLQEEIYDETDIGS